jgi:hypothetical protein
MKDTLATDEMAGRKIHGQQMEWKYGRYIGN